MSDAPSAAAAAAAAFAAFDWEGDARWATYSSSVEVANPATWPLVKAKWFKREVDPDLDVSPFRPAAAAAPKVEERPPPPPPPPRPRPTAATTASTTAGLARLASAGPGALALFALNLAVFWAALAFASPVHARPRAWRRFALLATAAHCARAVQRLGTPPLPSSSDPRSVMALLAWASSAARTSDGALIAFLFVASRAGAPPPPAALPAALLAGAQALEWGVSTAGDAAPRWAVRARTAVAARAAALARAAAGAELATGALLVAGIFSGRGGLWAALLFWRTYVPFRLNSPDGRHHAGVLAAAARVGAGLAARAGAGGVSGWLRALEGRWRGLAGAE